MQTSVTFTIKAQLPSLNEYINILKSPKGKFKGAKFKREIDDLISWQILPVRDQIAILSQKPVTIHFDWHEKSKRRDVDNVYSAKKYILDALQKVKAIPNDSPKYVRDVSDSINYDTKSDYVIVTIVEAI